MASETARRSEETTTATATSPSSVERWTDAHVSPAVAVIVSIVITAIVAIGDYLTGPYLVFATFYLVPVALAAWFAGRNAALCMAVLAAAVGVVSTALDPQSVTPPVFLWNGAFRLVTYVVVAVLVAAERDAVNTIHALASTDPLTGLMNRRSFYALAERDLARSRRDDTPVALVYVDVDGLKQRNDTYGHDAGDAMIVGFADAARETLRTTDLIARVGGDEFVFLLPATDHAEAEQVVARLRDRLRLAEPLPINFSAGVAAGAVPEVVDVERFVNAADALMIEAKGAGKGRTVVRTSLVAV